MAKIEKYGAANSLGRNATKFMATLQTTLRSEEFAAEQEPTECDTLEDFVCRVFCC